ncbi:MAG: hypothetical protein MUC96_38035 [Myxococcaceae bacterium]|nr:hypothetical protein [Myxococcaceae bacterium]
MSAPAQPNVLPDGTEAVDDVHPVVEQVQEVLHTANSTLNGLADAAGLTPKVEASPYGMVAAALGVGYVLGGGLFTPTTLRLVRLGMKLASIPAVRDRLLDVAESAVDGVLKNAETAPEDT